MASHKSSEKRARQEIRRRDRNNQSRKKVKTFEKKLMLAINEKSAELASTLKNYMKEIMKAASKGSVKKKTASRKLSRLSKRAHLASKGGASSSSATTT